MDNLERAGTTRADHADDDLLSFCGFNVCSTSIFTSATFTRFLMFYSIHHDDISHSHNSGVGDDTDELGSDKTKIGMMSESDAV